MTPPYRVLDTCRICGGRDLRQVVSLGMTPLANSFIVPERAAEPELLVPLEAVRCPACGLMQLSVVVRPDIMFAEYAYSSSASEPMVQHFDELARELVDRFHLGEALVAEFGSNDGVLLGPLAARGARAIGIDPSANQARAANARGLETIVGYFDGATARRLAAERGRAKAIVANNVLAHIDDLHGVVEGLDALLADDGVFVAEFPYLGDLLARVEYDTIYHEHLSYFALSPLRRLFSGPRLELFDVRRLSVHGGSIRIYVGRPGQHPPGPDLARMLDRERADGLLDAAVYERFGAQVATSRSALRAMLGELRRADRRIAALGASAKGNTLLNYCGIGPDTISFVGDSTPAKQGRLTPGMHIPVRSDDAIRSERPDFTLLLAWNYADAILERYADYRAGGGRFIHPVPVARILS